MLVIFTSKEASSTDINHIQGKTIDKQTVAWEIHSLNVIKRVCNIQTTTQSSVYVPLSIFPEINSERSKNFEKNAILSISEIKQYNLKLSSVFSTSFPRLLEHIAIRSNWYEVDEISVFYTKLLSFSALTIVTAIKTIETGYLSSLQLNDIRTKIFKNSQFNLDCVIKPMVGTDFEFEKLQNFINNYDQTIDDIFKFISNILPSNMMNELARYGIDLLFAAYGPSQISPILVETSSNLLKNIINRSLNQLNYMMTKNKLLVSKYLQELKLNDTNFFENFGFIYFSEKTKFGFKCKKCNTQKLFSHKMYSLANKNVHCIDCSNENSNESKSETKKLDHMKTLYKQLLTDNETNKKKVQTLETKLQTTEAALQEAINVNNLLLSENAEKTKQIEELEKKLNKQKLAKYSKKKQEQEDYTRMIDKLLEENEKLKTINTNNVFCVSSFVKEIC